MFTWSEVVMACGVDWRDRRRCRTCSLEPDYTVFSQPSHRDLRKIARLRGRSRSSHFA